VCAGKQAGKGSMQRHRIGAARKTKGRKGGRKSTLEGITWEELAGFNACLLATTGDAHKRRPVYIGIRAEPAVEVLGGGHVSQIVKKRLVSITKSCFLKKKVSGAVGGA